MAVTYTNELVLQLVQAYKNHELLWDPSNPDFKNRTKKNDAWDDIANAVNIPRRDVESKIHTLRSQFAREKKKIAQLRKNGNDLKNAPWFAYEPMKFLLKGDTETDGSDSSEMRNSHNDELSEPYHVENFHIAAPMPMVYESTDTTANLSTISRKRTNSYDDKSDDPMGYGFAKLHRPSSKSGHDEFEIYGQYVASELRETKDLHSVLVAKRYINDILIKARMGRYRKDSASNSKSKGIKTEQEDDSDVNDDE
ncbi:uncharacterized protein LOC134747944 [Cydia strobilella]|uniref:uncharacterized protein LOC134747944 n=1 Tax=Cydia strobilella TaxID=1100964 RepID=UPI00300572F6